MDFVMPAWGKRKSKEAPQSQGRRAVRQAVAEGGSEREVLRRLVDVLTTLSLFNAAELRDLTSTVFKTYLVPSSENVAEAMAEAGRLYHDSAGAIKNKPEAERADAQEQLGPPFVYVWVAFLRSLASTKELGAEHVAVLRQYWENSVLKRVSPPPESHRTHLSDRLQMGKIYQLLNQRPRQATRMLQPRLRSSPVAARMKGGKRQREWTPLAQREIPKKRQKRRQER